MIRTAIALGAPPLAVYRAACLSAAEAFGLKDRGLIAPGKRADIAVIDRLEGCHASLVLCGRGGGRRCGLCGARGRRAGGAAFGEGAAGDGGAFPDRRATGWRRR